MKTTHSMNGSTVETTLDEERQGKDFYLAQTARLCLTLIALATLAVIGTLGGLWIVYRAGGGH